MIDSLALSSLFAVDCQRCGCSLVLHRTFREFYLSKDGDVHNYQREPVACLLQSIVPDTNATSEILSIVSPINCFG
jgi:hypothetical protein